MVVAPGVLPRRASAMPIILWLLGVPAILIVLYLAFAS
jgi:hypothetical protein